MESSEVKPKVIIEERRPFGRSINPPIELCARNLPRPMYPLMIELCYFCQKSSSERDCFITDSGKLFFSVQMCPKCVEYNRAVQEAGCVILQRHISELKQVARSGNESSDKIPLLFQ